MSLELKVWTGPPSFCRLSEGICSWPLQASSRLPGFLGLSMHCSNLQISLCAVLKSPSPIRVESAGSLRALHHGVLPMSFLVQVGSVSADTASSQTLRVSQIWQAIGQDAPQQIFPG